MIIRAQSPESAEASFASFIERNSSSSGKSWYDKATISAEESDKFPSEGMI